MSKLEMSKLEKSKTEEVYSSVFVYDDCISTSRSEPSPSSMTIFLVLYWLSETSPKVTSGIF